MEIVLFYMLFIFSSIKVSTTLKADSVPRWYLQWPVTIMGFLVSYTFPSFGETQV